jgi:hypothetical protein
LNGDPRLWNGQWRYSPDDIRQFRRDAREWQADAQALRQQLVQAGQNPRELDQIIGDLLRFDNDQVFADPRSLAALQAATLEKMKNWEFGLRKNADGGENQPLSLSGSDEVPAGFRAAIEEYYRSLSRKQ